MANPSGSLLVLVGCFILTAGYSSLVSGNPLTIDTYLKMYREKSSALKQAKLDEQTTTNNLRISEELVKSSLKLEPGYHRNNKSTTSTVEGDPPEDESSREISYGYSGTLSQTLPWGTTLGLKSELLKLESTDNKVYDPVRSHSFFLSQPLWQNRLGIMADHRIKAARIKQEATTHESDHIQQQTCIDGINLFAKAFVNQQRYVIMNKILSDSKKLLNATEAHYRRGLATKIQYLSAQSDLIQSKTQQLTMKKEFQLAKIDLQKSIIDLTFTSLENPQEFLEQVSSLPPTSSSQVHPKMSALKKAIEASEVDVFIARERTKPLAALNVEVGKKTSENHFPWGRSSVETITNENYWQVGFSIELPINEHSKDYEVQNALNQQIALSLSLEELEKEIAGSIQKEQETLDSFKESREYNIKNIKIMEKQLQEAKKMLDHGKIEFEDYIRYRDRELTQKLEYWHLSYLIWITSVKIKELTTGLSKNCGL